MKVSVAQICLILKNILEPHNITVHTHQYGINIAVSALAYGDEKTTIYNVPNGIKAYDPRVGTWLTVPWGDPDFAAKVAGIIRARLASHYI